jgi:hypothetical protein
MFKLWRAFSVLALALCAACAHGSPAHPCATAKTGKAVWRVSLDGNCRPYRRDRVDLESCDDVSTAVAILNQEGFFELDESYGLYDHPGRRMLDGEVDKIEVRFSDGDWTSVEEGNASSAREPHFVAAARAMLKAGLSVPRCWRKSQSYQ